MTSPKLGTLTAAFFIPLFLFLSSADGVSPTPLIKGTCKQTLDYKLCVSTLTADPRSAKAPGVRELALIMIDIVKGKAKTTSAHIKKLLKTAPPPELKTALKECATEYGNYILTQFIPSAEEAVSAGDPKFGEDGMNGTAECAVNCEAGFLKVKSPLTKENEAIRGISTVTASMIRQLE